MDELERIQVIQASSKDIIEAANLQKHNKKLSFYDILNYILAKKHNGLLATGDRCLVSFAERNSVEVIRTLKIIELMYINKLVDKDKLPTACSNLLKNEKTIIPKDLIENLKNKI